MSDMMGIGTAISGTMQAIGELVGTMMTNDANNKVNRDNIGWQAKSLQATMNWQEYMRSTAYQATMGDMRKAGLNPMLAFAQGPNNWGSVGSSPGSQVRAENPHLGNAAAAGATAFMNMASAREAINTQRTTQDVQRSEVTLNNARAAESAANTVLSGARATSEGGVPHVQAATISQLIASARERLAQIPVAEAQSGAIRQGVVQSDAYGRGGTTTNLIEGLTALIRRLQGDAGSARRLPLGEVMRPGPDRRGAVSYQSPMP